VLTDNRIRGVVDLLIGEVVEGPHSGQLLLKGQLSRHLPDEVVRQLGSLYDVVLLVVFPEDGELDETLEVATGTTHRTLHLAEPVTGVAVFPPAAMTPNTAAVTPLAVLIVTLSARPATARAPQPPTSVATPTPLVTAPKAVMAYPNRSCVWDFHIQFSRFEHLLYLCLYVPWARR